MSMNIFAALTKVDEKLHLVYGRAADETIDKSNEKLDYDRSKPNFMSWSAEIAKDTGGKSLGNVRDMHQKNAIGKLTDIQFDDVNKTIDVCAKIVDAQAWEKVLEGVFTGFSIGGRYGQKTVEKIDNQDITRYVAFPSEISIVDRPCIPTATFFEIQKADGSLAKVEFQKVSTKEKAGNADKVTEATPKSVADDAEEKFPDGVGIKTAIEHAPEHEAPSHPKTLAALKASGTALAGTSNGHDVAANLHDKAAEAHKDAGNEHAMAFHSAMADFHEEQDDAADGAEKIVDGTAEQVDQLTKLMADNKLNMGKVLEMVSDGLAKIAERKDTSPEEGEQKYGDVTYADEKNKKYPLDTPEHTRAAASYWGMPKNKEKYSSEDQATISSKIAAAKKKHGIGDEADKADRATMVKVLSEAYAGERIDDYKDEVVEKRYAEHLEQIMGKVEEDNAPEGIGQKTWDGMSAKEKAKYKAGLKAGTEPDGDEGQKMARAEWNVSLAKLEVALEDALGKIGARHSAADKERIQAIHDHTAALGADCALGTEKAAKADDLQKVDEDTLQKLVAAAMEPLTKELTEAKHKIEKLEAQPMPSRIKLRAVAKGEDYQETDDTQKSTQPIVDDLGEPHEVASLIKAMHQKGGSQLHILNK